ncbi:MAG: hypothetical protein IJS81_11395 [Selenomonadaceae bacterium]|nr:hypothetical protein [Selenomonadaceae bacterium]
MFNFKSYRKEFVEFTMPLPNLEITSHQMQRLIEVSPDKQMPSTLFHLKSFIDTQRWRVIKFGKSFHEMEDIRQYSRQLKFMLMSVRVQYEQQTNADFPLE